MLGVIPNQMAGLVPAISFAECLIGRNVRDYHSAALRTCPSRWLSRVSSISAASVITVPGGKIASAPALRSALAILRRHHAADHDHDVAAALLLEVGLELRHQGEMGGGERGDAEDMDVVLDRLAGGLGRGGEQGADIHVEAEIGERGGDHLLAAVVAVLPDLGDQDARPAAFVLPRTRPTSFFTRSTPSDMPTSR